MENRNLARKGPHRVWIDYRNLRVPVEVFDQVRQFLEFKKMEYLSEQEGLEFQAPDISTQEGYNLVSSNLNGMRRIIKEEFNLLRESGGLSVFDISSVPARKKTSKERIKELLISSKGEKLTTIQIGEILKLPQPTCRQAAREMAYDDPTIHQEQGRPSKFWHAKD